MSKKIKKEVYVWDSLLDELKKFSGKDPKDWDDRYKNRVIYTRRDYETGNYPVAIWARDNGYNWEVLDDIYSEGKRFSRSKEEIDLRIKIREAYYEYLKLNNLSDPEDVYPQNFDDYVCTEVWGDQCNGSVNYFNPYEILESIKDEDLGDYSFVRDVLEVFIRFFKSKNMPQEIEVYVSW
jgi:hypothetical protein